MLHQLLHVGKRVTAADGGTEQDFPWEERCEYRRQGEGKCTLLLL